mgnify:FL=1
MGYLAWHNRYQRWKAGLLTALLRREAAAIGPGSLIYAPFHSGDISGLSIGRNSVIFNYGWLLTVSEGWGIHYQPRLIIGDDVYIGFRSHIVACDRIEIGNKTVIADNVYITDNLHGFEDVTRGIMEQPLRVPGPVVIGEGCWIGERACIMPNVKIGKHAVIGANAVVTKDIPEYSIAVGAPARVIKCRNAAGQWVKCE